MRYSSLVVTELEIHVYKTDFGGMLKYLLTLLLFELFAGGSGQALKIYGVPLRQILFILIFAFYLYDLFLRNAKLAIDLDSLLVFLILFVIIFSAFVGILRGHDLKVIFLDVSPAVYLAIYFPLKYYLKRYDFSFERIYVFIRMSSLFVSLFVLGNFFTLKLFFASDIFAYIPVVNAILGENILWFRPGGYVYYSSLIFVFVFNVLAMEKVFNQKNNKLFDVFVLIMGIFATIASMTKGLIIVNFIGMFFILLKGRLIDSRRFYLFIAIVVSIPVVLQYADFSRFYDVKSDKGVSIRIETFNESIEAVSNNILIGRGYGTELPSKKQHQENSFMDIFVEQGLVGVLIYSLIMIRCCLVWRNRYSFAIITVGLFLATLTNPYINNPLGAGLIAILLIYSSRNKTENANE